MVSQLSQTMVRHLNCYPYAYWEILHVFFRLLIFFKINFFINYFRNTIRVSHSLDPDQAPHFVEPELGQNYLLWLTADVTSRQRVIALDTISTLIMLIYNSILVLLIKTKYQQHFFKKNSFLGFRGVQCTLLFCTMTPPPPPPFHWTAIPLRSWRSRIFSKIIPNRR